jgi:hypothetical protein
MIVVHSHQLTTSDNGFRQTVSRVEQVLHEECVILGIAALRRQTSDDRIPLGDPKLTWSFNRDGEAYEQLKQNMHGLDEPNKREQRRDLVDLAHPQHGVDAMANAFSRRPYPGVVDVGRAE